MFTIKNNKGANDSSGAIMKTKKIMAGPRDGELRHMASTTPFRPEAGAQKVPCSKCGIQWCISRPHPETAKVRGPVWALYTLSMEAG